MSNTAPDIDKECIHEWVFSEKALGAKASAIREILKISSQPGVINFAGGLPAPELFPKTELLAATQLAVEKYGESMFQYSVTQGVLPLRERIAERMTKQLGVDITADLVQITTGSQQGLDLIGRTFLNKGDYILTERPTYLGALQAFSFYTTSYCTTELESDGPNIDEMEAQIKRFEPKIIYLVPDFQNPTGITTSAEKRQAIVDLSRKYKIPIVDDNPYGELRYSGEQPPTFKELGGDGVIQLGTFSKTVSPGLRIGTVVACEEVLKMMDKMKQSVDLHTTTFAQYMLLEYINSGRLDSYHLDLLRKEYGHRRNTMIEAMEREFPPEVTFTRPKGGLFLWVTLPDHISTTEMLEQAVDAKVAYVPGKPFYPHEDIDTHLRLNFCNAMPDKIKEGVKRLAGVFNEVL